MTNQMSQYVPGFITFGERHVFVKSVRGASRRGVPYERSRDLLHAQGKGWTLCDCYDCRNATFWCELLVLGHSLSFRDARSGNRDDPSTVIHKL